VTLGSTRQVTANANNLTVGGNISGTAYGLTKTGSGRADPDRTGTSAVSNLIVDGGT